MVVAAVVVVVVMMTTLYNPHMVLFACPGSDQFWQLQLYNNMLVSLAIASFCRSKI